MDWNIQSAVDQRGLAVMQQFVLGVQLQTKLPALPVRLLSQDDLPRSSFHQGIGLEKLDFYSQVSISIYPIYGPGIKLVFRARKPPQAPLTHPSTHPSHCAHRSCSACQPRCAHNGLPTHHTKAMRLPPTLQLVISISLLLATRVQSLPRRVNTGVYLPAPANLTAPPSPTSTTITAPFPRSAPSSAPNGRWDFPWLYNVTAFLLFYDILSGLIFFCRFFLWYSTTT